METAWPICALYLIDSDMVLVLLHFKKKQYLSLYINIYTDLSLHRTALVKGYIFPLQLKINKMVSNIPPVLLFFLLVFPVNRESFLTKNPQQQLDRQLCAKVCNRPVTLHIVALKKKKSLSYRVRDSSSYLAIQDS